MRFLLAVAATAALSLTVAKATPAFAGELDNEASVTNQAALAKDLPATLVVRINKTTNAVEVMNTKNILKKESINPAQMAAKTFVPMNGKEKISGTELDGDSSSSSWYFGFPSFNFFSPSYYYGGYNYGYTPYYNYGYGNYNYYYYSNPYCGYGNYGGGYGGGWGGYGRGGYGY